MGKLYIGNSGSTSAIVKVEEVPKTKFGASIDSFIGDVDVDGVLQRSTTPIVLNFAGVTEIGNNALQYVFYGHPGVTSVDLSSLTTVGGSGLSYAFYNDSSITSVDLSSLTTVGSNGLNYAFYNCSKLTTISFPSLTSVQTSSFYRAFNGCTILTEIHFRADMQATIETLTEYADKFGAMNATIYFDL